MSARKPLWRVLALLATLSLVAAACGDDDDEETSASDTTAAAGETEAGNDGGGEAQEFSIAFVGPLTGDAANLGIFIRDGAKVAVEQFNEANPDLQITLEEFDTQGDPAQAPTVLDDYITDESILGIVGPAFSGETKAVLPTLDENGLVMVSASATNAELPDVVPDGRSFHRVLADDAAQAAGIAKYLTVEVKPRRSRSSTTTPSTGRAWPSTSSPPSSRASRSWPPRRSTPTARTTRPPSTR
jgi:branched-chain amino acid transport system substrate-binding protein